MGTNRCYLRREVFRLLTVGYSKKRIVEILTEREFKEKTIIKYYKEFADSP